MDASWELAGYVQRVRYEDIPKEVVGVTKKDILDLIGVTLAGSTQGRGCKEVVELVKEAGGKEESSIIGFGGKVPAWMAAFANGAMAHALDYDTYRQDAACHAAIFTVPAAFAIAERVGKVNGKEFIAAITLGNDIIYRLGLAVIDYWKQKLDWLSNCVYGPWGATAASAKLLRLDEDKVIDAFGIALHQAAGTQEMAYGIGSIMRGLYASLPAKTGVLSALMAQKGITGSKNSLEGRAGFLNVYYSGNYKRACLTDKLGERFEGLPVSFKLWPCCGGSHTLLTATLRAVRQHDILPEDVEEITAFFGSDFQLAMCQPLEARRKPPTSLDAGYSIPFMIATAIAKRRITIGDLTSEALKDPVTLKIAQKVVPKFDPELSTSPVVAAGRVEIKMKKGQIYSERADLPSGHPDNPMSMQELVEKFRDCASYAAKPLSRENVDRVIEMVGKLEEVEDVSQIIQLVS